MYGYWLDIKYLAKKYLLIRPTLTGLTWVLLLAISIPSVSPMGIGGLIVALFFSTLAAVVVFRLLTKSSINNAGDMMSKIRSRR